MNVTKQRAAGALLLSLLVAYPGSAWALQPLETFLDAALAKNPDALLAKATLRQREAEVSVEMSKLLPSFTGRGVYTRNQYAAEFSMPDVGTITITPKDQLDAFLTLDVPIIDLSQFARYDAQKTQREVAKADLAVTERQLKEQVIRAYFTLAAVPALQESAQRSLESAQANLQVVKDRVDAGTAPDVDLAQAQANLARAEQDVADVELSRVLAMRQLETLSRIPPQPPKGFPHDDLRTEAPLKQWLSRGMENLPELRVAELQVELAEDSERAAAYAYLPTLSAQGQERITNVTGFTGQNTSYTLSATLSMRFDLSLPAQQRVASAAADQSRAIAMRTQRTAEDTIVEAWQRVKANIAKGRAARAQLKAADRAASLTNERYTVGAATQLDVINAQREAFDADVARIRSDLDLLQSRSVLRLAAGDADVALNSIISTSPQPAQP